MATAATIAAALQDDAETRALMQHGLNTYRGDAAMYAQQISRAMALPVCSNDERQALDELLAALEDRFYAQVDLCVELLLGF